MINKIKIIEYHRHPKVCDLEGVAEVGYLGVNRIHIDKNNGFLCIAITTDEAKIKIPIGRISYIENKIVKDGNR